MATLQATNSSNVGIKTTLVVGLLLSILAIVVTQIISATTATTASENIVNSKLTEDAIDLTTDFAYDLTKEITEDMTASVYETVADVSCESTLESMINKTEVTWDEHTIEKVKAMIDDMIMTETGFNKKVLLFRGVSSSGHKKAQFVAACAGVALPGGWGSPDAHQNLTLHNSGKNPDGTWGSTNSLYVGFTMLMEEAYTWATNDGNDSGVILVKMFTVTDLIASPDKYGEYEFLHYGPVKGCLVIPVTDFKKIAKYFLKQYNAI